MRRPQRLLPAAPLLLAVLVLAVAGCSRRTTAPLLDRTGAAGDRAASGLGIARPGLQGANGNAAAYGARARLRPFRAAPGDVPQVRDLRAQLFDSTLEIRGELSGAPGRALRYDPFAAGGWMLQVFINADQDATGYWLGFDYIVRGGELLNDHQVVVRRIAPDPIYPGGWGPQSGVARLLVHDHSFVVDVPLAAIGNDDGRVDFLVETYATVACPDCGGGVTQIVGEDYAGTTLRIMPVRRMRRPGALPGTSPPPPM